MSRREEHGVDNKGASADGVEYVLQLFVTGASPNSIRAIRNLKELCEKRLKGRYSLEIIDVYQEGALAQKEQIFALPVLVKKLPLPERRLIGDMSETDKVLKGLGLQAL